MSRCRVPWAHRHHASVHKGNGATCDFCPLLRCSTVDWEVILQPETQLYLEGYCFIREWVLLALRSSSLRNTLTTDFVFIYWRPLNLNVDLWVVSSFRTAGAFPWSPSASWCTYTRQVMVLHFPLVSLAPCGSYCVCLWDLGTSLLPTVLLGLGWWVSRRSQKGVLGFEKHFAKHS